VQGSCQFGNGAETPAGGLLDGFRLDGAIVGHLADELDHAHRIDRVGEAGIEVAGRWQVEPRLHLVQSAQQVSSEIVGSHIQGSG
jgi:hypothetical protein